MIEFFIKLFIVLMCIATLVIIAIIGGWEIIAVVGVLLAVMANI